MSELLSNADFLKEQYGESAQRLRSRISIYQRFLTGQIPWHDWLYERLEIRSGFRVADVGCGTGELWLEEGRARPVEGRVELIDQSQAMIDECRRRFRDAPHYITLQGEAQSILAREQAAYDLIVASHVIYHMPEPSAFVNVCSRALAVGGRLVLTTVGSNHLRQLRQHLRDFASQQGVSFTPATLSFTHADELEGLLKNLRRPIRVEPYHASLLVTEAAPLVEYVLSTTMFSAVQDRALLETGLTAYFQELINREKCVALDVHNWLAVVK